MEFWEDFTEFGIISFFSNFLNIQRLCIFSDRMGHHKGIEKFNI